MSSNVPIIKRGRDISSPPIGGTRLYRRFALLGHPGPHVGDGELEVFAEPVCGRAFAVHAPVVDGRDRYAQVVRQLGDIYQGL